MINDGRPARAPRARPLPRRATPRSRARGRRRTSRRGSPAPAVRSAPGVKANPARARAAPVRGGRACRRHAAPARRGHDARVDARAAHRERQIAQVELDPTQAREEPVAHQGHAHERCRSNSSGTRAPRRSRPAKALEVGVARPLGHDAQRQRGPAPLWRCTTTTRSRSSSAGAASSAPRSPRCARRRTTHTWRCCRSRCALELSWMPRWAASAVGAERLGVGSELVAEEPAARRDAVGEWCACTCGCPCAVRRQLERQHGEPSDGNATPTVCAPLPVKSFGMRWTSKSSISSSPVSDTPRSPRDAQQPVHAEQLVRLDVERARGVGVVVATEDVDEGKEVDHPVADARAALLCHRSDS